MKKVWQLVAATAIALSLTVMGQQSASASLGGRVTYTFAKEDKLQDIADRYGVTLKALRKANGLAGNRVIPNTVLTIPTTGDELSPHLLRKIEPQAGDGKVIYVSLSQQRMWAYQDDQLFMEALVSTGLPTEENPNRDTKPGVFRIKTKMPEAYAGLWGLRMPYWLGIYDSGTIENGFHAMPLLRNGRQIGWRVGTRGSYGCVVLNTKEAKQLYDWAEFGTIVVIRN
jgi:lipoprotein-anchoring transpeptidase ErfK/SrfK